MADENDNPSIIEDRVFASDSSDLKLKIPYILTPRVEILQDHDIPTLNDKSEKDLSGHFDRLANSDINKGGAGIIFGTYDNLHIGHKIMLKTAASICDELYVGIESQSKALERKKNKHPILDDTERIRMVKDFGVTADDKIFIRSSALQDILRLEQNGKAITTLIIGESQKDNPEIVEAVDYCFKKDIQVIATTRVKVANSTKEISSSSLHKGGAAKVSLNKRPDGNQP